MECLRIDTIALVPRATDIDRLRFEVAVPIGSSEVEPAASFWLPADRSARWDLRFQHAGAADCGGHLQVRHGVALIGADAVWISCSRKRLARESAAPRDRVVFAAKPSTTTRWFCCWTRRARPWIRTSPRTALRRCVGGVADSVRLHVDFGLDALLPPASFLRPACRRCASSVRPCCH